MSIWNQKEINTEFINEHSANTAVSHLGIKITEITGDTISGSMPVDERTVQPFGILHGGASCVLAESLGSIAANLVIDNEKLVAVGQSLNINHIRPSSSGFVTGTAKAIHLGKSSHVWEIKILNDHKKIASLTTLTMAIIKKANS